MAVVSRSCGLRSAFGWSRMSRSSSFGRFAGSSRRAYMTSRSLLPAGIISRRHHGEAPERRDKESLSGPKIILFKVTSSHVDSCESRSNDAWPSYDSPQQEECNWMTISNSSEQRPAPALPYVYSYVHQRVCMHHRRRRIL